ncbi:MULTISPECIES: cytochrome b/b6 domain-containing protein [Acidithiobacillus]|jgi:hypothetical protein|uniref:cytochrome b/b6 domain-containing protein n=1 Tax=Acidithiobacillus TaxID=119977 RepID=UPI00094B0153|nr:MULTISPECIES: cytochrome b/b6 domain-containing protein [Acidithiobacillus]MBE7561729.1 cytochrome b/b6 domain-containing protein [Acidithiobacillus sp. HP-6]MBE7568358.1 cytochrome b/b6 domain-containing protein [Acidithiobacillus sp. HP-2]MDD5279702.1 cytochrome b/b6 domain-containing protein [Acidithiobacillus sp.]
MHGSDSLPWPRSVKWLHIFLALFITFQLMSELDMKAIWKHVGISAFRHFLFVSHMWVGMASTLVIILFWLVVAGNAQLRAHLFPYHGVYLQRIGKDIQGATRGIFPPAGMRGGLPGLVHGLGLLAISTMGASGVVMFVMIYAAGGVKPGDAYGIPHAIHSLIANLVWAYWWGHIAMALLHALRTPRILRIFIP